MAAADKAATEAAADKTAREEAAVAADRISDRTEPAAEVPCAGADRWQDVRTGSRLTQR